MQFSIKNLAYFCQFLKLTYIQHNIKFVQHILRIIYYEDNSLSHSKKMWSNKLEFV